MAIRFLANILLTFIWIALTGGFTYSGFIFGFVLSFGILWVINASSGGHKYFKIIPKIIVFIFYFIWELTKANLQVAWEVITPKYQMKPGIVRLPLDAKTDLEITLLANLITLTPGTLTVDVSDDRKVLYVHSMFVENKDAVIDGIKNGFEKRLLEILR